MMKRYVVRLTDKERKICEEAIDRLQGSSRAAKRCLPCGIAMPRSSRKPRA